MMKMKMTKKVLSVFAIAALVAGTVPAVQSEVKAAAPSAVKVFDFENGTGMSSSGIAGAAAPTVVSDSERGNVLKMSNGETSKVVTFSSDKALFQSLTNNSTETHSYAVAEGTPSSLKFTNPFKGKDLSNGATIAMWVKLPSTDAVEDGKQAGLIGFVDSRTDPSKLDSEGGCAVVHPDPEHTDQVYFGRTFFGIAAQPYVYFQQIHHNTFYAKSSDVAQYDTAKNAKWQHMIVSIRNTYSLEANEDDKAATVSVYLDGAKVDMDDAEVGKRFNGGDGMPGNSGMTPFLDFLSGQYTEAYVGFTGFSPTYDGVCIDDLAFYTKAVSDAEATALYNAAKSGETTSGSSEGSSSSSSSSSSTAAEEAEAAKAAAEAAALAEAKATTEAVASSITVVGMPEGATQTVKAIIKGDESTGAEYTAVETLVNSVNIMDGYKMNKMSVIDISFGGVQPNGVATVTANVPNGYNTDLIKVLRINDDNTVSILNITSIADGKISFLTNHFTKFAIVELAEGTPSGASSKLPKTGVVSTGVLVALGAASIAGGVVASKKKKEEE